MPITWKVEHMEWAADGTVLAARVRATAAEGDRVGTLAGVVFLGEKFNIDTITEADVLAVAKQRLDVTGIELAILNQITPPVPVAGRGLPWVEREELAAKAAAEDAARLRGPARGIP